VKMSARQYREKKRKQLTLSSGSVFTIRKPGRTAYMKLLSAQEAREGLPDEIPDPTKLDKLTQGEMEKLLDSVDAVLASCIIEPKVVIGKIANDDELSIEDIEIIDYFELLNEVIKFADLTEEKMQELFRSGGQQPGGIGGGVSSSVEPTPEPNPSG